MEKIVEDGKVNERRGRGGVSTVSMRMVRACFVSIVPPLSNANHTSVTNPMSEQNSVMSVTKGREFL